MDKLITIKRSDGSIEKVTNRELDALNESKHLKKQLNSMMRQRNRLALLLTVSWFLFIALTVVYFQHNDSIINQAATESAADIINIKNDIIEPAIETEDESVSHASISANSEVFPEPTETVTEARLQQPAENTPEVAAPEQRTILDKSEIIVAIENWSRAWSEQNFANYVATYSRRFKPDSRYSGYDDWASTRKKKVVSPEWILVTVSDLKIFEPDATGKVITQFRQSYSSKTYKDVTIKQLHLEREDGHWLIMKELSI